LAFLDRSLRAFEQARHALTESGGLGHRDMSGMALVGGEGETGRFQQAVAINARSASKGL